MQCSHHFCDWKLALLNPDYEPLQQCNFQKTMLSAFFSSHNSLWDCTSSSQLSLRLQIIITIIFERRPFTLVSSIRSFDGLLFPKRDTSLQICSQNTQWRKVKQMQPNATIDLYLVRKATSIYLYLVSNHIIICFQTWH